MMTRFCKHLAVLALTTVIAACADPATTPHFGKMPQGDVSVLAHERLGSVDYYGWMGRRFAGEAELIAALESRMGDELEALVPETEASGKTLRVVLPPAAAAEMGVGRFYHRLDELRLDGLRKSALVGDFEVENTSLRDPGTEGRDFVLYRSNGAWRMKDQQGRMVRLLTAGNTLSFVAQVKRGIEDLSGDMDFLSATSVEGGMVFNYRGKEYTGLRGLRAAFDTQLAQEQKQVVAVASPLADTALVVLPMDSSTATVPTRGLEKSYFGRQMIPVWDAQQRFDDRRAGQAIAASGLFKSVRVVTANWAEPEQGAYDWVFWRVPGQAKWMMRSKDGLAFSDSMPDKPETFAEELRAKLTQPR